MWAVAAGGIYGVSFVDHGHATDSASTAAMVSTAAAPAAAEMPASVGHGAFRTSVHHAAEEIQHLGHTTYIGSYTGLYLCNKPRTVYVYRVPNHRLDAAVRAIGRRHATNIVFRDTTISYARMLRLGREIDTRRARLAARGAYWQSTTYTPHGDVEVGVTGNVESARRLLSGLDPHVVVRRGSLVQVK